jgi:glycosyltransferase involved in cell wall biosynthesis
MLGWEFPPHSVGGLGRHTYELVKALSRLGIHVDLVLPFEDYEYIPGVNFHIALLAKIMSIYKIFKKSDFSDLYENLYKQIDSYTKNSVLMGKKEQFDVIQANDWLTARAGIELKKITGKPLIVTIHSTEYDRTIGHPWEEIVREETYAVNNADIVVAVSERLKDQLVKLYGVPADKIVVIHNAIDKSRFDSHKISKRSKVVLYVGRLSLQKGIDNLIHAFKIVSEHDKDALLYIVGEGPEMKHLIELSIDLGLSDKVIFFGRVSEEDMENFYSLASVFVMPSVSEPFGITALEAVASKTPTIVSLQSGASEILKNVFKVDFWDSQQIADLIIGLFKYRAVGEVMSNEAYSELTDITWENSAKKFIDVYNRLVKK